MLIRVTKLSRIFKNKSVLINTDTIKKVVPIDRNYTEDVCRIHFLDGEVMDTNFYVSELLKLLGDKWGYKA